MLLLLGGFAVGLIAQSPGSQLLDAARRLHREGEFAEAAALYRRSLPLLEAEGNLPGLGSALNGLSLVEIYSGRYQEAIPLASRAVEIRRQLRDTSGEAAASVNLGLAHYYLGDYREALAYYLRALELDTQLGDFESQVLDLNNIANVHFIQGNYGEALGRYQQALKIVEEESQQPWASYEKQNTLVNLAALLQKLGAERQALQLYHQVEQEALAPLEKAQVLSNLGALFRHLGDPYKALEAYRQAEPLFRQEGAVDGLIQVSKNIGIAYALDLGELSKALQIFQEATAMAQQSSNRREEMQTRLYVAETLWRMGMREEAGRQFEWVRETAEELGTVEEHWKSLFGLARLQLYEGHPNVAQRYLQKAADEIGSLRAYLGSTPIASRFLAGKQEVYRTLIDLVWSGATDSTSLADGWANSLLRLIESARAAPFRDYLWQALEARGQSAAARELRELRRSIAGLMRQALQQPERRSAIEREIAALESRYLRQETELRSQFDIMPDGPLRVETIRKALPPGALLVLHWLTADRVRILAISDKSVETTSLETTQEQLQQVGRCARMLTSPESDWKPPCTVAGDLLLGPLADQLKRMGPKQLIFSPDTRLSNLPLEALPMPSDGRLLIESYSISYLPSLRLIHFDAQPPGWSWPWDFSLLALADPRIAPDSRALLPNEWQQLSFAREEARYAQHIVPGRSQVLLGAQASKAALLKGLQRQPQVVLLATHALNDPSAPERSRILLAPSEAGQPSDYLFLSEVVGLPLRGVELVMLSACETAVRVGSTGGLDSFGLAFLSRGVSSVVATQWRVEDRASAELMERFLSRVVAGQTRGDALRWAKLDFLRSGEARAHPFYWAGFLLFGESTRPLVLPLDWRTVFSWLLLAVAALAAAIAWRRYRASAATSAGSTVERNVPAKSPNISTTANGVEDRTRTYPPERP